MGKPKSVHAGHRQRMRKRFLASSFKDFSEHELIEMLLYYVSPRADTNPIAHRLLDAAGGMAGLTGMSGDELDRLAAQIPGCPSAMPQTVQLITKFEQTYLADKSDAYLGRPNINDARSVCRFALDLCAGDADEATRLLCIDNRMSVKCSLPLCIGRPVSERLFAEIVRLAIGREVSCVILVCTHFDGNPAFTQEELSAMRTLSGNLRKAGVRLLDVILCCDGSAVRLCTTGMLADHSETAVKQEAL